MYNREAIFLAGKSVMPRPISPGVDAAPRAAGHWPPDGSEIQLCSPSNACDRPIPGHNVYENKACYEKNMDRLTPLAKSQVIVNTILNINSLKNDKMS